MSTFRCPGRTKDGVTPDFWTTEEKCSYCGSVPPNTFWHFLDLGYPVTMSKESRSFFFNNQHHFCYHHLDDAGQRKLKEYYDAGKLQILNEKKK